MKVVSAIVLFLAAALVFGGLAFQGRAASAGDIALPSDYRNWRVISVAHEEGKLNDLRVILGNDAAFDAARSGAPPFPDGAMIARLAWVYTRSEENNKVFGRQQSFVAGAATNVQLMVKDSRKFAETGGWGYAQFKKGNPANEAAAGECFACHKPAKSNDFVFTHYAP